MNAGAVGALAALLLGLAVLLWPSGVSARATAVDLWGGESPGGEAGARLSGGLAGGHGGGPGRHAALGSATDGFAAGQGGASLWRQDPVDLYRRWRLRRRPGALVDDVLDLLRGIGPALGAGLTPSRAIELAATSTLGAERVQLARQAHARQDHARQDQRSRARNSRHAASLSAPGRPWSSGGTARGDDRPAADIDRLVGSLLHASHRAEPTSPVWAEWAARSASAELALVAAAWRLSENTGAPLASAVDRAVGGLLDARTRRGKVAVAVAGPRATVTVLTLLPLTGPIFGLACGIDPATLYLGSPIATVSVVAGVLLVWVGRVWCSRMVRRAVRP
ncbi:hypothetical protein ASH01_06585 [Terrabacter sp. Soil811]|uniref:type II secretion system F family protein n=1 Tax=Terrabacter sp. Soil811 TaxID=1736419 RepID=UPI0006FF3460|nr:hypothetical protein [Terrabacter sp. Soil811]KRF45492.1 hypothetical protein ASH01_06585 [Terrabacter sp. Soil811]